MVEIVQIIFLRIEGDDSNLSYRTDSPILVKDNFFDAQFSLLTPYAMTVNFSATDIVFNIFDLRFL
jgi:hypothetical protein